MTVTGIARAWSSKTWVIPSFCPRMAFMSGPSVRYLVFGTWYLESPSTQYPVPRGEAELSQLYLHFNTSRELETHQRIDRFGGRLQDVDQTFVNAHLEMLT